MYKKILVALDNTHADESLLPHVARMAAICGAQLLLVHVADGWAARNYERFQLQESDEMKTDRAYLDKTAADLRAQGLNATAQLALGNPPEEILRISETENCDLIAMTTHGHRFLGDLLYGSTISKVRHKAQVPLLIVRAQKI
jgi:nucleotide-binding universal stress UspA family protein